MFAIIKSGGLQHKVSVGDRLEVNRLHVEDGEQIEIGEVLLISDADTSMVGAPFVEGARVVATVVGDTRGKKLIVFKYKSKKRYRHRRGHRQELTVLTIDDIIADGKSLHTGKAPSKEEAPADEEEIAPVSEAAAEETAQKPSRRRRTAKTEESSTEE